MCVYVCSAVCVYSVFAMQVNPLCQNHAHLPALNTASRCIKETKILEQIQALMTMKTVVYDLVFCTASLLKNQAKIIFANFKH